MLQIDDQIISTAVFDSYFQCDLKACKGVCCVYGSAGAPLNDEEAKIIETIYPVVKKYLPRKAIDVIDEQGFFVIDEEGDTVTPIVGEDECVYAYFEDGIALCAIEKAYFNGEIDFRKPISCHLYPIRISKYSSFEAVNYDKQDFCKSARDCGQKKKTEVFRFLREALIRKYGEKWYAEMQKIAKEYDNYRKNK